MELVLIVVHLNIIKQELGYWLGENYWGKGIMSNAVKGLLSFIWNTNDVVYNNLNQK